MSCYRLIFLLLLFQSLYLIFSLYMNPFPLSFLATLTDNHNTHNYQRSHMKKSEIKNESLDRDNIRLQQHKGAQTCVIVTPHPFS